jgi:hypothetical protein
MSDERAAEGLDHLQRAATEVIAAARAFLDVAEELVTDRERVADVVGLVGSVASAAAEGVGSVAGRAPGGPRAPEDESRIQHIDVS